MCTTIGRLLHQSCVLMCLSRCSCIVCTRRLMCCIGRLGIRWSGGRSIGIAGSWRIRSRSKNRYTYNNTNNNKTRHSTHNPQSTNSSSPATSALSQTPQNWSTSPPTPSTRPTSHKHPSYPISASSTAKSSTCGSTI